MKDTDFFINRYLDEYGNFLNQLLELFNSIEEEKEYIQQLKDECDTDKISRGTLFYESIDDDELFELFCKSKIKVFSSKDNITNSISTSLFGEKLSIKKLLNNQLDQTKEVIWNYLHLFYLLFESINKKRKSKIDKLASLFDTSTQSQETKKAINNLINVDLNETTNNMISDIVNNFQDIVTDTEGNGNIFENIMGITQSITEKYNDKIESGEIEIDKLMESIQKNIPGMGGMPGMDGLTKMAGKSNTPKEKVIIDENFSTDNVEVIDDEQNKPGNSMNIGNMLNMMNTLGGNDAEGGGFFSILGKLDKIETDEDAEKLKEEMDIKLKEMGVDMDKLNEQIEKTQELTKLNMDKEDDDGIDVD